MDPKVFYSVFGINGFGVYTDYEKVLKAKQYLNAFNCKKHKTYLDAKSYAIASYNERQESSDFLIRNDTDISLPYNWTVFRKDIFVDQPNSNKK